MKYSTFDRELLAVFLAVKKWRDFFCGSNLTVFTDHKPLIGAIKGGKERFSDRQQRQLGIICEYVTEVVHVAGRDNVVADTLSRNPAHCIASIQSESPEIECFDLVSIAKARFQLTIDDSYKPFVLNDNQTLYCEVSTLNPKPFLPENFRKRVFDCFHLMSRQEKKHRRA